MRHRSTLEAPIVRERKLVTREVWETDRKLWNAAVQSLPTGHVLQSYEWGELKANAGWRPLRLVVEEDDVVIGAALALKRKTSLGPFSILYVPKGPALDPCNHEAFESMLNALALLARRERAIFLRLDPDITIDDTASLDILAASGYRPAFEQVQFRNTMVVDLSLPEEELRRRLSKSTRYHTNVAVRNCVRVDEGSVKDLPLFFNMYRETAERDQFAIRGYSYYESAWELFLERDQARLFFARHEGEPLAACLTFVHGQKAWYMYGASRTQGRELRASHLLHWQVMLRLKAEGFTYYDLWGLPNILREDHPMWGLVQFKRGLGGELRQWIGAYDYVVNPAAYLAYRHALPRLLALWRRILRLPSAAAD